MMKRFLSSYFIIPVIILSSTIVSCDKESTGPTYLSGKIVNPRNNFIVLNDYQNINDTILLHSDGSFFKKYDYLPAGLYTFSHPNEYQSIYLAPGDSIAMRLNTRAFDETLAFSGSHNKENNYLINLFTRLEIENPDLWSHYKNKDHSNFKSYVDSLRKEEHDRLNSFVKQHSLDEQFICHAQQVIDFAGWSKLERYAYAHYGKNDFLRSEDIPNSFFAHRDELNIDNAILLNNYAYRPYINSLISHLAFKRSARSLGSGKEVDRYHIDYHMDRLSIIDSLFKTSSIKDAFAANNTRNFITSSKSATDINKLLDRFLSMTSDEKLKSDIATTASTYISLNPGNMIPDIEIHNINRDQMNLSDRINKLSVLFFWSDDDREYAVKVHDQIRDLRVKYPEIDFIGVNLDDANTDQWKMANQRYKFDYDQEFQIINTSPVSEKLALRNRNRSMIIDKDLMILDPSINLFHYQIETTLLGYINK